MRQSPPPWWRIFLWICIALSIVVYQRFNEVRSAQSTANSASALQFVSSQAITTTEVITVLLPTVTPTPLQLNSPLVVVNEQTPTPTVPAALLSLLPEKAEPLMQLSWQTWSGCGQNTTVFPYQLSADQLSLAAIQLNANGYQLLWDWKQEADLSTQWLEIRPMPNIDLQNGFAFFGKNKSGQWWIGIVVDLCHVPYLDVLLPVNNPLQVKDVIAANDQSSSDPKLNYWVIEGRQLTQYDVLEHQAVHVWTFEPVLSDVMLPWWGDIVGDESPELILQWGRSIRSQFDNVIQQIGPYQIFQQKGEGYQLIGEVEPDLQFTDVDGDGESEFLRPFPLTDPAMWKVYRWQEDRFAWDKPLPRPTPPLRLNADPQSLQPIPLNFYFKRAGQIWMWPSKGGVLQQVESVPNLTTHTCDLTSEAMQEQMIVSFSPDCNFALKVSSGPIEGSSNVILNRQSGQIIDVPGTFTYSSGYSTFAWDPQSRYLIHARADGSGGLFRIDLSSGEQTILLSLQGPIFWDPAQGYGAVEPFVFPDDTIGFTVQSQSKALYPIPGVYRLQANHQPRLITDIPVMVPQSEWAPNYGLMRWSANGSMFLYFLPRNYSVEGTTVTYAPPYDVLLLGTTDPPRVWNLNSMFGDAQDFQWESSSG